MNLTQRRHAWLHRLALVAAALVLSITSLSAFIRLSNAGLGCDEWPQCYGSRLRAVQQSHEPDDADSALSPSREWRTGWSPYWHCWQ